MFQTKFWLFSIVTFHLYCSILTTLRSVETGGGGGGGGDADASVSWSNIVINEILTDVRLFLEQEPVGESDGAERFIGFRCNISGLFMLRYGKVEHNSANSFNVLLSIDAITVIF